MKMGGNLCADHQFSFHRTPSIPRDREPPTIRARSGRHPLGSAIQMALEAPPSPETSTMAPTTPAESDANLA